MPTSDNRRIRRIHYARTLAFICTIFAFTALFHGTEALACAACGDALSREWGTQGIRTTPGFTADLSYVYINQNQQRYGSGTASSAQFNNLWQAGQEVEDYTVTVSYTHLRAHETD